MKVLVAISHVPDTTTRITFTEDKKALNKQGVTFIINPYDEFSLSYAVGLKEQNKAKEVIVLCVGPKEVESTLKKALAIGADKAVRIDTEPKDAFIVAANIAAYAKEQNFDLLLFGKESIDFNGSQVPGMVAELLQLPFVSFATKMEIENGKAKVTREISGGSELLEVELPLVLSAQKGLAKERIPNMRGIMMARRKPVEVIAPTETQPKVETLQLDYPKGRTQCKFIDPENIDELVQVLVNLGALN